MARIFHLEECFVTRKEIDVFGEVQISQTGCDFLFSTTVRPGKRDTRTGEWKIRPVVVKGITPSTLNPIYKDEHRDVGVAHAVRIAPVTVGPGRFRRWRGRRWRTRGCWFECRSRRGRGRCVGCRGNRRGGGRRCWQLRRPVGGCRRSCLWRWIRGRRLCRLR